MDSILPDIHDVARGHGLRLKAVPGRPDEKRANCPFCSDKRYHLYLNQAKNTYHCYRCGAQGGVVNFLAQLTGRSEMALLDELRGNRAKPEKRKKPRHPAETLTALQLKAAGFRERPNWPALWAKDPQRARDTADWIWSEWQAFLSQKMAEAFESLLLGIAEGHYQETVQRVRARGEELGVDLLAPVLRAFSAARLPAWAREGKERADLLLGGVKKQSVC